MKKSKKGSDVMADNITAKSELAVILDGKATVFTVVRPAAYENIDWELCISRLKKIHDNDTTGELTETINNLMNCGKADGGKNLLEKNRVELRFYAGDTKLSVYTMIGWDKDNILHNYMQLFGFMSDGVINPIFNFMSAVKTGKYSELSDEEYGVKLDTVKAQSVVFGGNKSIPFAEWLLNTASVILLEGADSLHIVDPGISF